jgi:peroxiredoxin
MTTEATQGTQVGNYCTDIMGQTPAGNTIKLSDYAGKGDFILVDFWASWCVHCVKEMPALKKLYQKYHDKGFEIVGVSLDTQEAAWKISIERLGLTWVHLTDLNGWEGDAARSYTVELIPCMVLIDPNGVIVYRGRSGDELEQMLATALDQQ